MPSSRTMIECDHGMFASFSGEVPYGLDASLSSLGTEFEITEATAKRYRASGLSIPAVELALTMATHGTLQSEHVSSIDIVLPVEREPREAVMEADLRRPDADAGNRIGSVRFLVGSIAVAGRIDEGRYERPPDAQLGTLLAKIQLSFEPGRRIRYVRIEVTRPTAPATSPRRTTMPSPSLIPMTGSPKVVGTSCPTTRFGSSLSGSPLSNARTTCPRSWPAWSRTCDGRRGRAGGHGTS